MDVERAEPVAGFRAFWEKSKREVAHRNLTFVQVEDGGGTKRPRKKRQAGKPTGELVEIQEKTPAPKSPIDEGRREQVYEAQKRHRNRKKEYARCLRGEKLQLHQLLKQTKAETEKLTAENEGIKEALLARGLDPDETSLQYPSPQKGRASNQNQVESIDVEFRNSEEGNAQTITFSDEAVDPRIKECRTLLLKDIEDYGSDEEQEKSAWKSSVHQILKSM